MLERNRRTDMRQSGQVRLFRSSPEERRTRKVMRALQTRERSGKLTVKDVAEEELETTGG